MLSLPKSLNRATYLAVSAMLRAYAGIADRWRVDQLGLPRRRGVHDLLHDQHGRDRLVLPAYSRLITPVAPDRPTAVRPPASGTCPKSRGHRRRTSRSSCPPDHRRSTSASAA
jgi:hypothetical protein